MSRRRKALLSIDAQQPLVVFRSKWISGCWTPMHEQVSFSIFLHLVGVGSSTLNAYNKGRATDISLKTRRLLQSGKKWEEPTTTRNFRAW
mmetsp:Transcript_43855/g.105819  ORF Transcript_43855/g.105819 Transcript_43855/m.105819 type:complete len:90 (+) Transcript_43855:1320-1589(+)